MQRSLERYEISPEEFFDQIDRSFAEQRAALAALAARADALTVLCEELARGLLPAEAAAPAPTRWTYDVRLPNYLFDDVYEPEPLPSGAKRWVGRGGRIGAVLHLPRNTQYDIAVQIEDFASEAAARSFWLRIDGVQHPWLSHDDKRYTSVVLGDPEGDVLGFEIGIDAATLPVEADTSFSFRSIDIVRRS